MNRFGTILLALLACAIPSTGWAAPAAPSVAIPSVGSTVQKAKPVIQWTGDAHDAFEVHVNTTNLSQDANIWNSGTVVSTSDTYETGDLANGAYYVFVRLRSAGSWGNWSAAGRSFQVSAATPPIMKGWVLLRDDLPYNLNLISKAREYHVNHVQISHDIVMYAWEPINDATTRSKINQMTQAAHDNGVEEVVIWVHDIQFTNMPGQYLVGGKVNLDNPGFWTWLESQYDTLFSVCPNIDGLVLTFSENFEGADFMERDKIIHTGKTPTDTLTQAIQTVWNSCSSHGKSLYVRTWSGAGADRWTRDAILRCDPAIWMMSKATGAGDWNVIQEDYDIIGTCTGHREMIEFDVCGEYWGMTTTPWAGLDYLKHLWTDFSVPRGADGAVARVDRANSQVLEGPNRIDMYALDILADTPGTNVNDLYTYWCYHWFGQSAGDRVASALKRTFDITNACYNLPTIYSFSDDVARDYCLRSLYDIEYVAAPLKAASNFQSGETNYQVLRDPLANAAGLLGLTVPSTLFGDFSPAYSTSTSPTCSAYVVDASVGLNPSTFRVAYSKDGGATWTNHSNMSYVATGNSTAPYRVTATSVPFTALRAARNKIRFTATNLTGTVTSKTFTVRGLDYAQIDLGSGGISDGIYHPQGGDGDTVETTAGGRSCRHLSTIADVNFYFQVDDGFAYNKAPATLYLQVDYYGTAQSITPIYDGVDRSDQTLSPVYLGGSSTWRTTTWRLDNVNFGNRAGQSGSDLRLYAPSTGIYISGVRLYYSPPAGMIAPPQNLQLSSDSPYSLSLTWDPVPGAVKYQVCREGACISWPTETSFLDGALIGNSQRTYTVAAFDASGYTSVASAGACSTTLPQPPTPISVTCPTPRDTWQTSPSFTFTAVGGFGWGTKAYYRYAWDESPTHAWTGGEPSWPSVDPPTGAGWSVWTPDATPTDNTDWMLYDGSTTQRCMSEQIVTENGVPAWKLSDQGRVQNTKAKLAAWPDTPISRDTGATLVVRMKAADSPLGWWNSAWNFGFNLPDCEEVAVVVRPDWLQITGPIDSNSGAYADNGFAYHTYTLTMKNATPGDNSTTLFNLYKDGEYVMDLTHGPSSTAPWSGPTFGHCRSDATGTWYFQYLAWRNDGAFAPPSPDTLVVAAPHNGSRSYLHIRAFNADGTPGGTLDLGPYYYWNGSDPLPPVVADDGDFTTRTAIHATWAPTGPTPDRYEYAIGSSPGAQDVVQFTNAGLAHEVTRTGLSLVVGHSYYVSVRGVVGSIPGTADVSDGIVVAPDVPLIGQAKSLPDGSPAALYGKLVSAVFADCAYVQEAHGPGIRIFTTRPLAIGNTVDLAGTMGGSGGERTLDADAVFTSP